MFGKQPKDELPSDPTEFFDMMMSSELAKMEEKPEPIELFDPVKEEPEELVEKSETVRNVEQISKIVSPYFIVLVGLILYEKNFFFGTIAIAIGIVSLLKFSRRDVNNFLNYIKEFFNSSEPKL
jgi:hypothetical protein